MNNQQRDERLAVEKEPPQLAARGPKGAHAETGRRAWCALSQVGSVLTNLKGISMGKPRRAGKYWPLTCMAECTLPRYGSRQRAGWDEAPETNRAKCKEKNERWKKNVKSLQEWRALLPEVFWLQPKNPMFLPHVPGTVGGYRAGCGYWEFRTPLCLEEP